MKRRSFLLAFLLGIKSKAQNPIRVIKEIPCDGRCCKQSPLRKIIRNGEQDCEFRNPFGHHDINSSCNIMEGRTDLIKELTFVELLKYVISCEWFPHRGKKTRLREENEKICCYRNI